MRRLATRILFAGGAAAAAVTLAASAAFAATWTVTNPNSDGSFSSALTSGTQVHFVDTTTNQPFTCSTSSVPGHAASGTGLSGTGIATLQNGTFGSCHGNFGSTGTATLSSATLNAVSFDSGTNTVTGNITGVNAALHIDDLFGSCDATVTGSVGSVQYNNTTGTLTINADATPQLTIHVPSPPGSGCARLINDNDKSTFAASYVANPKITITSP